MDTIDTTNGRLERVLADLRELIGWADADYEHSYENDAADQARDDFRRGTAFRNALRLLNDCPRR